MVFMDEFLFFDPRALPVILPTLANGAALVLTSSIAPNVADDLMRMLNVKYSDGTRVVNVLNWIVSCRTCKKLNKSDRCTHVVRRPQHFQKSSDVERQAALMSVFSGAYEREMLNVPDAPTREPAFNQEAINWLSSSKEAIYDRDEYVPRFFVCIDPNGGSFSSDMVLSSCAYIKINGVVHMVVRTLCLHFVCIFITSVSVSFFYKYTHMGELRGRGREKGRKPAFFNHRATVGWLPRPLPRA